MRTSLHIFAVLLFVAEVGRAAERDAPSAEASAPLGPMRRRLAVGTFHTCAIVADGRVKCWGLGNVGQLGDGRLKDSRRPVEVSGIDGAFDIVAGDHWTCAVVARGRIKCWGYSRGKWATEEAQKRFPKCFESAAYRRSGHGTPCVPTPHAIDGIENVRALIPSYHHVCALTIEEKIPCWSMTSPDAALLPLALPADATRIVIGKGTLMRYIDKRWQSSAWGCAMTRAGRVECRDAPFEKKSSIDALEGVVDFAMSAETAALFVRVKGGRVLFLGVGMLKPLKPLETLVVHSSGSEYGNVGAKNPIAVPELEGAVSIAETSYFGCALFLGGELRCWGTSGSVGRLGTGNLRATSSKPKAVKGLDGVVEFGLGHSHACALTTAGAIKCWGQNKSGQLGDGSKKKASATPVVAIRDVGTK